MLIKFTGAGKSDRSFIESLQRTVTLGEVLLVKDNLARTLLETGRWRKIHTKPIEPPSTTPQCNGKPDQKPKKTKSTASSPNKTDPPIPSNKEENK